MCSAVFIDFRFSNAYNFRISGQKRKVWVSNAWNILVLTNTIVWFAEVYTFLTPAPVASVLEDRHIMQHHHRCDVICDHVCRYVQSCMISHCKTFCYASKLYIIKRKFKFLSWIWHLFHLMKRKIYISFVPPPLMKYTFFTSLNERNVIFIPKIGISSIY